jgi:adenylosuccinate synthase
MLDPDELGNEIEAEGIADSEGNYAEQILRKGLSVKKVSDKEHIEERLNQLINENNQIKD